MMALPFALDYLGWKCLGGIPQSLGMVVKINFFEFSCINLKHGTFGIIQLTLMFCGLFKVLFNLFIGFHNDN